MFSVPNAMRSVEDVLWTAEDVLNVVGCGVNLFIYLLLFQSCCC